MLLEGEVEIEYRPRLLEALQGKVKAAPDSMSDHHAAAMSDPQAHGPSRQQISAELRAHLDAARLDVRCSTP